MTRTARASVIGALLALAAAGCDQPIAGDDGGADAAQATCGPELPCPGALVCLDGVCQVDGCERGTEGCACATGSRCARGSDGMPLVCGDDGVCSSMTCPAGQTGCACLHGTTCADDAAACVDRFCIAGDCEPGTERCSCLAGSCDPGLHCLSGSICVSGQGYEGGACLDNDRCHRGARCDAVLDTCVYCELGSEGCACRESGGCGLGLACVADLCVSSRSLPPADPRCYTPCRDSLVTGTGLVRCGADGLMDGCVGDQSCVDGSCVAPGESAPACEDDLGCPFFQTCLLGRCYSNCVASIDCAPGHGCHQRVCRVPCESSAGGSSCGAGLYCDAPDGEHGYCVPLAGAPPVSTTGSGGAAFSLSATALAFSNVRTSRELEITVEDDRPRRHFVTIRRLSHTLRRSDGTEERVEAERDPVTGALAPCDAARGECPLAWLDIAVDGGSPSRAPEVSVSGLGGCAETASCPSVEISNAAGSPGVRWEGVLEIAGDGARSTITVTYVERPEGQWVGAMHYFGSFPQSGIAEWRARADRSDVTGVSNALIRRWSAFRQGNLSGGWEEMRAVLTATATESWALPAVAAACPVSRGACYPYTNTSGVRTYATDIGATPIPRGVTELPFLMNLRQSGLAAADLVGRVDTAGSLHYPGDPAVTLSLASDPASSSSCSSAIPTDCVVFIDGFEVESVVGGRYVSETDSCAPGYTAARVPWLVEGFRAGSTVDASGSRTRTLCLDAQLPFDTSADATLAAANRSLAGANPVPDGAPRYRRLSLLDGALVNQTHLFILFEETFESFVDDGSPAVSAYGYALLSREPANLDDTDADGDGTPDVYQGNTPPVITRTPPVPSRAQCDAALVRDITGNPGGIGALSTAQLDSLVDVLVGGTAPASGTAIPTSQIHYYCEDTGLFDGGAGDNGSAMPVKIACPAGSRVVFFSTTSMTQAQVAAQTCQSTVTCVPAGSGLSCTGGTCQETLTRWIVNGIVDVYEPYYQCNPVGGVEVAYCDDNRLDLRAGKTFYRPAPSVGRTFLALQPAIEAAFRYRTRFTSSDGRVGFAPELCIPGSDRVPYCYDPEAIEELLERVDCLVHIYADPALIGALTPRPSGQSRRALVESVLKQSFSEFSSPSGDRDGFERLYAELLVMQGDEALTRAFASRFDLAGAGGASFEGSRLEPGGIDLSGVAGLEMVSLYRAVQLYELALDRLYGLGPDMTTALSRAPSVDSPQVFLSAETVVLYLERLIRASTQKARAYGEIARRYQGLNRPDLAWRVLERAYGAAYLESTILTRLMDSISDRSTRADRPQIELAVSQAQRRYRMALLDMRSLYGSISENLDTFGFAPDYIPFPALDASARGQNAFEVLIAAADSRASFARMREEQALASNRSFQTDSATFQSELVRIRNTYESQLLDLCGSFVASDGRPYPAIRTHAPLHPLGRLLGDPCGQLGNGAIHTAIVEYRDSLLAQQLLQVRFENLLEEVRLERARVVAQCALTDATALYQFREAGRVRDLRTETSRLRTQMELVNQSINAGAELAAGLICITSPTDPTQCLNEMIDASIRAAAAIAVVNNTARQEATLREREAEIATIEAASARWVTEAQCDAAEIDSNARTATLLLQLRELEIEALRADYQSRLKLSEIGRMRNQAARLQDEQAEAQSLLIDVEAARNDPNVRVYRNDAVINADIAFADAMRAAYRATRVFEYYTSQTYAGREQLYLIRMVSSGTYNLENYLLALRNAFSDFEETFGSPDSRVLVLSLRDDVMDIPRLDGSGRPVSQADRIEAMRARLADVDLLDESGYITLGFGTSLERLSPLTRNHKITYIEAELIGSSVGDTVGRIYLRPVGTGVVHSLAGTQDYYVFPQRTAVINPFFNGSRVFAPEVYQNHRLRDRPMVNTAWELVINQRDEVDNRDIDLASLSDIRLYVYYTDFTAL